MQVPQPSLLRHFERAANINRLTAVFKSGGDIGKTFAGWTTVYKLFADNAPGIIDWLMHFL